MKLFELFGTISVDSDDAVKAIDKAKSVAKSFAKVGAAAFTTASAAVTVLTKTAVENYAEYEQLVGGVETLFGAGGASVEEYAESVGKSVSEVRDEYDSLMRAQTEVLSNADNAYKTAGLSANEYMDTVTSFSASLLQGLGGDTEEAAQIADMAITDMADNANKMGTSMESIQNAYQGFAKQNYTMLDNLKLGYGGTQEEMIRLINDSGILEEKIDSLDGITFDQMIMAIHEVQDEMGITGTTADEASTTIEGSVNSMKAAWTNLTVGLADDTQDFNTLVNNFVDSTATAASNLLPRIETALTGIGILIEKLEPTIAEAVPALVSNVLPSLIEAAASLITALIDGLVSSLPSILPALTEALLQIVSALIDMLPQLLELGIQLIVQLALGIAQAIPQLLPEIVNVISAIVTTLLDNIPTIIDAAIQLLMGIVEAIPEIITALTTELPKIIESFVTALNKGVPQLIQGAIQLFNAIVEALPEIIPLLIEALPELITSLIEGLMEYYPKLLDGAIQLLMAIIEAIPQIITSLVPEIPRIVNTISDLLLDNLPLILDTAITLFMALVEAIPEIITALGEQIPTVITAIITALGDLIPQILLLLAELLVKLLEWLVSLPSELASGAEQLFTWFSELFGKIWDKIKEIFEPFIDFFSGLWDGVKSAFSNVGTWFKEKFTSAWANIKDAFSPMVEFFSGIWDSIKEIFSKVGEVVGDAITNTVSKAVNAVLSTAVGIINGFITAINFAIGLINEIPGVDINKLDKLEVPEMEQGGVLEKGQVGLLEGNGAEAVVPLENNRKWISKVAADMDAAIAGNDQSAKLDKIIEQLISINNVLPDLLNGMGIRINNREFGRLVRQVTS